MKLLITGGTGFIGSHLSIRARAHGHRVIVAGLTNTETERKRLDELRSLGFEVSIGALQDHAFARSLVADCDAVIHLAAAQHEANVPDAYFRAANVDGTRALLDACVQAGVKRFIYGSTIGVYGAATDGALSEESPPRPANIYGVTKLEAEATVRRYAERLDTTIIRISETYGPSDLRLLKLFKAVERGWFAMIGGGLNKRQPIHVQDLVRGFLLALEHPAAVGETFLLAGPMPITTHEMVRDIAAALDRPVRNISIPIGPLMLVAGVMERVLKPLGIQPPLHRRRLDFFTKSFWFLTSKAQRVLGFEAMIPFAVGARDTASWYRNQGLLRTRAAAPLLGTKALSSALVPQPTGDVPLMTFDAARWNLADILEYTHDAIIIWEMDGVGILYWNRAAEQLYGFSRQEALGRSTHLLLQTQIEGTGVAEFESKLARYGVWVGNLHHRRRDGAPLVVHARLALMSQQDGRWLVLEVNRDVTAMQVAQEASNPASAASP